MGEALKSNPFGFSDVEKLSQDVFMTPEEFDFITTEQLVSVTFSRASNFDFERGFTGGILPDKKWTIDKTGMIVKTDKFSIELASQLSGEERGIAFLKLLDKIRFQEEIKKNGSKTYTVEEGYKKTMQVEQGARDFYTTHQRLVDNYLNWIQTRP